MLFIIQSPQMKMWVYSPSSLIVQKKKKRKKEREVIGLGVNYVGTRGILVTYFKI